MTLECGGGMEKTLTVM